MKNRYYISGKIILLNDIYNGSGKIDTLVKKDRCGIYFISASIIIGGLRHTIESILFFFGFNHCHKINENLNVTISKEPPDDFYLVKKEGHSSIKSSISNDINICPLCQLFGSTNIKSKIIIDDLHLINEIFGRSHINVAIDRFSQTIKSGTIFESILISKGTIFKFELIGEDLNEFDLGLLALGFREMVDGNFWLGSTSKGVGRCKLDDLNINYFQIAKGVTENITSKKPAKIDNSVFFVKINDIINYYKETDYSK